MRIPNNRAGPFANVVSNCHCAEISLGNKMFSLNISRSLGVVQAGFHYLIQGVPLGHYSKLC